MSVCYRHCILIATDRVSRLTIVCIHLAFQSGVVGVYIKSADKGLQYMCCLCIVYCIILYRRVLDSI